MNEFFKMLILAIVQGMTEWLPISSSGHLVLFEKILGFKSNLDFDIALHFGTLLAVILYFSKDIVEILGDLFNGNVKRDDGRLGMLILVSTIPAAFVGFFFKDFFERVFDNTWMLALGFGITGLFLIIASLSFKNIKKKFGYKESFFVGIAQAIAIIPSVSRSGATIASCLLFGLDEKEAIKFSFLMSIPVIFGASLLSLRSGNLPPDTYWAIIVSFLVGLLTIHLLFKYVLTNRRNLMWFGIYALLLALAIMLWIVF